MVPGVSAEILEERPGMHDRYLSDIWCPVCGVTKFLTMVTPPKTDEQPTIQKRGEPDDQLQSVRQPGGHKRKSNTVHKSNARNKVHRKSDAVRRVERPRSR